MGIWRVLYEEARDVLGMEPPPENPEQRAARVARELREVLKGTATQRDGAWFVGGEYSGLQAQLMLEAALDRASIGLLTERAGLPDWSLRAQDAQGGRADEEPRYKALGLSAQSDLRKLLEHSGGEVSFHEGRLEYTPEAPNMTDRKAKDVLRRQLGWLASVARAIDKGW